MKNNIHLLTTAFNNYEDLQNLLNSLSKQVIRPDSIIVVNHGESSLTSIISKHYPRAHVINGAKTLWWTGALNLGIESILKKYGNNGYLITINSDCEVPKDWLKNLIKCTDKKTIVGSIVVDNQSGKIWDNGVTIDWKKMNIRTRENNFEQIDAITTKGTLFPLSLFSQIGKLDNRLPHYISDYELTIRAKNKGYKLEICEKAIVKNKTGNTGLGDRIPSKPSYKQVIDLMFSRKSKLNISDHYWLITLCCPKRYKFRNYVKLLSKIIYLLVLPTPPLHRLLKRLKEGYNGNHGK